MFKYSWFLLILSIPFVYAMNSNIETNVSELYELPKDTYRRKTVKEQCENYRKSFDILYEAIKSDRTPIDLTKIRKSLVTTYNPYLLNAFKDGIRIVRDFFFNRTRSCQTR